MRSELQEFATRNPETGTVRGKVAVSVILPIKNGRRTLAACLHGIFAQKLDKTFEVIAIDSGSTDGSVELLSHYPVRMVQIAPEQFNHGNTRNLGARLAQGEFVVMTVQDARPMDSAWLERMLRHFRDPKVAGVCGQQIVPHERDKNPLQWFRPYSEPLPRKIWFRDPGEFEGLSPAAQLQLCGWDNVTATYRRSALLELPFRGVTFGEDIIWARDALSRGHALVYDCSARVCHYHHQTFGFRFRRTYTIRYHIYRSFGHFAAPSGLLPQLARCAYRSSRRKYIPTQRAKWFGYNIRLILSEWLAGWHFVIVFKTGGNRAVEKWHRFFCATPPQSGATSVGKV